MQRHPTARIAPRSGARTAADAISKGDWCLLLAGPAGIAPKSRTQAVRTGRDIAFPADRRFRFH